MDKENQINPNDSDKNDENKPTFQLVNSMEVVVLEKAKDTIQYDTEVCKCEKCFYDICAIVLNSIKPKYSTTNVGTLYVRASNLEMAEAVQMSVEVAKAIELVKKRPAH